MKKLKGIKVEVFKWNREVFGDVGVRYKELAYKINQFDELESEGVVDGLGRLVDKAKALNEVRGLEEGRGNIEISHIQFADDTLFLVKSERHVMALVERLNSFGVKSGLKIILENSIVLGINFSEDEVDDLALAIGCKKDNWLIKYLGVPLGVPSRVAKRMEKLMRDFLWDEGDKDTHCHVVGWNQVCKQKDRGGLGLGNICLRNKALLRKWWWICSVERETLWKNVIKSIFGLQDNGWNVGLARNSTFRSPWKFIYHS
ncbi:uncharacterized protein LOC142520994 [Primulina tabacum]|uniref:uncharacterized protein LOC142520994 n=1 Tax=Primulina tabacum TaxID=48773 RepID=UPI003F5A21DA